MEYEPEIVDYDFEGVQPFLEQLSAEELRELVIQIDAWFKEKPSETPACSSCVETVLRIAMKVMLIAKAKLGL